MYLVENLLVKSSWLLIEIARSSDQGGEKTFLLPSEFSIIFGVFPSITATAEFVVPVIVH